MFKRILVLSFCVLLFLVSADSTIAQVQFDLVRRIDVAPVWSGHPVGFALLTEGDWQFAAFYDANRNMTLAQRKLNETAWIFKQLPTKVEWDSHNYITITLDRDRHIHVSGNMHCVPLIYFRSEKPLDVTSLVQVASMTGSNEKRCTYPQFIEGAGKELLFTYRDGGSGNGNQIWNIYDADKKSWSRLFDTPMFNGQGKMNAYFYGPIIGPDGYYHLCWMWRNTPDCSTNHDLSYVRSRDMKHWENSQGTPVALPITLQTGEIIDAAQPKQGLLNPAQALSFDLENRVVISYGKYDAKGNWQLYNARLEDGVWKYYQTSNWNYRWDFKGGGTIPLEISFGAIEIQDGQLVQSHRHIKEGNGRWQLDEKTLKPIRQVNSPVRLPKEINKIELDFPNIEGRTTWDLQDRKQPADKGNDIRYVMKWETLPPNRDRPHPVAPPPSQLRVYEIKRRQNSFPCQSPH
ncbi:MAG: BNR repeat-containing protein [Planctomycetaceae bacterium]|nr:BNR repeat-containing protein [Planctomycetaceae bacterium]